MPQDDETKRQKALERLRDRVKNGGKDGQLAKEDRDVLIDFSDELYLRKTEYSVHRHEKLLRHCVRMAEHVGGLSRSIENRDNAEEIVRWINKNYDNEETNRDYRIALRVFGRHMTNGNGDEPPESLAWIHSGTSRSYDPQPSPGDMLRWDEDILPMIEATHNNRDAAIIAVAFDAGTRSGEFRQLTVGDISDHRHGLQISVDGKTGQRTITLIPSVPYLHRWLQDHPAPEDPSATLWSKLHSPDSLSFRMFKKILESAAERAGVTRPVNLTNFRKSSASYLASKGMSQAHLEEHHGWTRGSDAASRYIAIFGDAAENELARIHGLDVAEEESEPIGPVNCPRCEKETPRDRDFCVWCEQALDQGAVEQLRLDERKAQRVIFRMAKEDPSILEEVEEREQIMAVIEDDPELQRQAKRFLEAL